MGQVSFQSKNPDFLFKNPDFLLKNPDFLLKNVDFIIKTGPGTRPDTHNIHVLPTTDYDNAAGASDKTVNDVSIAHLRPHLTQPEPKKTEAAGCPPVSTRPQSHHNMLYGTSLTDP